MGNLSIKLSDQQYQQVSQEISRKAPASIQWEITLYGNKHFFLNRRGMRQDKTQIFRKGSAIPVSAL